MKAPQNDDWQDSAFPMDLPERPFVGIFGSFASDWRRPVRQYFSRSGTVYFDSTNPGWKGIKHGGGPDQQDRINALVAWQRDAIERANCVVFFVDAEPAWLAKRGLGRSLASRFELGLLAGLHQRVFVALAPGLVGRQYLLGAVRVAPSFSLHDGPLEAAEAASDWLAKLGTEREIE